MRSIKFRFWNPPGKAFVQQYKYKGLVDELFEQDDMLIPSQFTGLKDDFGNEIWEGDVIELKRKDREGLYKAEIQFVEGAYLAKFIKHEGTLSFFWLPHLNDYCNIKVIGNIFANPEFNMNTEIEALTGVVKKELDRIKSNMDEVDKNDLNCITDAVEWLQTIKQIDIENKNIKGTGPNPDRVEDLYNQSNYHYNFDCEIVNNASGYITAPVFTYKTKVEASEAKMFKSLQEMKDFLKDKKYLLYMIIVSIKAERVGTVDNGMYTVITNRPLYGTPEIRYTFRGHILT